MRLYFHPILLLLLPFTTGFESLPQSTLSTPTASTCPFTTPIAQLPFLDDEVQQNPLLALLPLHKRQVVTTSAGQCPVGFFGCSNYGAPQACCANTAICTTDQVNHVACCASGASCTGIIGSGTISSTAPIGATTTPPGTQTPNQGGTVVASSGVVIVTAGAPVGSAASAVGIGIDGKGRGSVVALVVAVGIAVAGLV